MSDPSAPPELPRHDSPDPPQQTGGTDGQEKANAKTILSWSFGCLFILGGLTTPFVSLALIWLAMGLVLIPPTATKIGEWTGKPITPTVKRIIVIGGLVLTVLIGAAIPDEDTSHWDKWIGRVGDIGGG